MAVQDFTAIGSDAKRNLPLEESYVIVMHFPTAVTDFKPGQLATLLTTGAVARITAATQRPLGYVVSSWMGNDSGNVRISTPFVAVAEYQNAAAAINASVMLMATGIDANGVTTYATATTGNYVVAQALSTSTGANTPIKVGILRVPYLLP